jgi:hypothetical protein
MTPTPAVKPETGLPGTLDVLSAGSLVDRLAGLTLDQLRALDGRLEDATRIVRAIIRERMQLKRRDTAWRLRELDGEEEDHQ